MFRQMSSVLTETFCLVIRPPCTNGCSKTHVKELQLLAAILLKKNALSSAEL
jgi:hypothetical protein